MDETKASLFPRGNEAHTDPSEYGSSGRKGTPAVMVLLVTDI